MPLVTSQNIKNNSPIENLVNDKLIDIYIDDTEKKYLVPVLGKELYTYLVTNIDDLDQPHTNLVNRCIRPVSFLLAYEQLPSLHYKITTSGVVTKNSSNSEPVGTTEIDYIRKDYNTKGRNLLDSLKEYLEDNKNDFPLFKSDNQIVAKKGSQFGIYLETYKR